VTLYEKELARLEQDIAACSQPGTDGELVLDLSTDEYGEFLRTCALGDRHMAALQSNPAVAELLSEVGGENALSELLQLSREAGYKTTPMHELIADNNALGEATEYMKKLEEEYIMGLDDKQLEQWSLIYAKFRHHPLRLVQRYWRHKLGIEKVFQPMSTDPEEVDPENFGVRPFKPLNIPAPKRLTTMYKRLARRVHDDIRVGTEEGDDKYAKAGEALDNLHQTFLRRQFWEARGARTSRPLPSEPMPKDAPPDMSLSIGARCMHLLVHLYDGCDADVLVCKEKIVPILREIAEASPGEFNQSIIRSIDDPSAYRSRFSGSPEQVEKEVQKMWNMLEQQVYNDALKQSKTADGRYRPSDALELA